MYFSRIRLQPGANPRSLIQLNSYREHQVLWNLFDVDPQATRDFLFRRENCEGVPTYYVISKRQPSDLQGQWKIETKDYKPKLHSGQALAFSLRANPVVTRKDEGGKPKRNDLVMDLKKQTSWQDKAVNDRASLPALVQQAGEQWLSSRLKRHGAQFNNLQADGYQQHRSHKRGQDKPIRYSTLDLQGTLTVSDPERLRKALFHGIGPAKAFGCGLLLVRHL